METFGRSTTCSPKGVISPHGASNLYDLHLLVIRSNVLVLDQYPEQSDRLSYPRLDLCLVKSLLVFPNGLWLWAKFLFVRHLKLLFVLPQFWHVMLVSPISATRKMCVVMFPSSLLLLWNLGTRFL